MKHDAFAFLSADNVLPVHFYTFIWFKTGCSDKFLVQFFLCAFSRLRGLRLSCHQFYLLGGMPSDLQVIILYVISSKAGQITHSCSYSDKKMVL